MCPDFPRLAKCPACHGLFWLAEAHTLGEIASSLVPPEEFRGSVPYAVPTEEEYLQALVESDLPRDKERYLRFRAWWSANDLVREDAERRRSSCAFSARQLGNLEKLSSLLDETAPQDRLLKAEIAREGGRFEEAAALLSASFPPDWAAAADLLRSFCHRSFSGVAEWAREWTRKRRIQRIGEVARRLSEVSAISPKDYRRLQEEGPERVLRALCGLARAVQCSAGGPAQFSDTLGDHLDLLARPATGGVPASPQGADWYYIRAAIAELSVACHRCLKVLLNAEGPIFTLMKQAIEQGLAERLDPHPLRAICSETMMSAPDLDIDFVIEGAEHAVRLLEAAVRAQK